MKELIQKIAAAYAEIAKAAKDGDNAALIAKLEEAAETIDTASKEAEALETNTATQAEEVTKMKEKIDKWADMYVSAEDFKSLLDQFQEAMKSIESLTPIAKTVEDLTARIATIEKTEVPSGQEDGEAGKKIDKSANPLASAAARFN